MGSSRSYVASVLQAISASCNSCSRFNEILAEGVTEESFDKDSQYRFIFSAISSIYKSSSAKKIDKDMLLAKSIDMAESATKDPGRSLVYEHKITDSVETAFGLDPSAVDTSYVSSEIIKEFVQKKVAEELKQFSDDMADGTKNASQCLKDLGDLQIDISRSLGKKSKTCTIREMKDQIIDEMTSELDPPVPTGFPSLDEALLGGLQKSYLVYVAGRPGMAKTQILINMMIRAADTGKKVLFMTYELPAQFIVKRILAYKSELTLGQLIGGVRSKEKISDEDIVKLETLIERLEDNIFICDAAGMNIAESAAFVKSEIESKGISSAYFDYVQIIRTADGRVPDKESDFASISFILRELAASQQIPVVAAAQLNREVEKRKDKRPVLSDLRSSGSLENDARVVLGLYRDEYYNKFSEDKDILEISILKNTNGELNTLRTFFNKPKCTILELEENREEPNDAYTSKNRFHQSEPDIPDVEESDFSAWES